MEQQQQQTSSAAQPSEAPQPPSNPPPPSSIPPPPPAIQSSSTPNPKPNPTPNPNPNTNPNPNPNPNPSSNANSITTIPSPNANINPSSTSKTPVSVNLQPQPQQSLQNHQTRPPVHRPWQHQSHFQHFSSNLSSSSSSPSSSPSLPTSSSSPAAIAPPSQRGGIAIGVPAVQPTPFSSLNPPTFGQQYGGLGRTAVNVPDSVSNSNASQVRPSIQGSQGMGVMGTMGSGNQMRPGGIPANPQQRPVQSSLRPQSTNFQGQGLLRVSSVGSSSAPSPNTSQSMQPHNQPWLSSGSQGKPPLPSPSFRPQMTAQSLPQRSHIPQQHHHSVSAATQPQQMSTAQQPQQPLLSHQQQEHYGQQFPPTRAPQSLSHPQQIGKVQGPGNQRPSSLAAVQPSMIQPGPHSRTSSAEASDSGNRILSKRSIHELVTQIDPSEKLDPEIEDILVDIAEDFIESITTFGCSLAKHRKSPTLEAKDILVHLERNWNMALPGFGGDEIKTYKKPFVTDIHKERLAAIKKSVAGTEAANTKSSSGQGAGNTKSHPSKTPVAVLTSPNLKIRDAA